MRSRIQSFQKNKEYWKSRSAELLEFELPTADINWKDFYIELQFYRGQAFAIGGYFPINTITNWLASKFQYLDESETTELFINTLVGTIELDRLDIYQELKEFWSHRAQIKIHKLHKEFLLLILESDAGWNILLSELATLQHLLLKNIQPFLRASIRSTDIAHYLLIQQLGLQYKFPKTHSNKLFQELVVSAPENISYYFNDLGTYFQDFSQVVVDNFWYYNVAKPKIRNFIIQVVQYMSRTDIENVIRQMNSFTNDYTDQEIGVLEIMVKYSGEFLEFIQSSVIRSFVANNEVYKVADFKNLYRTLKADLSVYIEDDIFEHGTVEIIQYIVGLKQIPQNRIEYFKLATDMQHPDIRITISEVSKDLPEFTDHELRYLMVAIIKTIYIHDDDKDTPLVIYYIKVNLPSIFPIISKATAEALVIKKMEVIQIPIDLLVFINN